MESPYRMAPPRAEAHWRNYGGLAIVGTIILVFNLMLPVLQKTVTLSADRAAGVCHIDVRGLINSSTQTVALDDLTEVRARSFQRRVDSQVTVPDVEVILVIKGKEQHLPRAGEEDDRVRFAEAAEAFIHAPAQRELSVAYGKPHDPKEYFAIPLFTGVLFLGILFLSPYVRIIGDRAAGKLIFERRPFGRLLVRRSDFPLDSVTKAEVRGHGPGTGKVNPVMLVLSDGSCVSPGAWAAAGSGAAGRLCNRINRVLAAARG